MGGDTRGTLFVTLDPDFHAVPVNQGRVLFNGAPGARTVCLPTDVTGTHKLMVRTDVKGTAPAGTGPGVFVVPVQIG